MLLYSLFKDTPGKEVVIGYDRACDLDPCIKRMLTKDLFPPGAEEVFKKFLFMASLFFHFSLNTFPSPSRIYTPACLHMSG